MKDLGETLQSKFEKLYSIEDPWKINNSIQDRARTYQILDKLKFSSFKNGIDLGCGEGGFTSKLASFVKKMTGLDISETALGRARFKYSSIDFVQGTLLELDRLPSSYYDLITCFEAIYYIEGEGTRDEVLKKIKNLGTENCVFIFSVVTLGRNKIRKYFTLQEATEMFAKHFNIINIFPVSLKKVPLIVRIRNKLFKFGLCSDPTSFFVKIINRSSHQEVYQTAFILIKKIENIC